MVLLWATRKLWYRSGMANRAPSTLGLVASLTCLGFFLSGGSCVDTDVGAPCRLAQNATLIVGPGCDETVTVESHPECFEFHPNREDLLNAGDKEYVSFGAAECDNLTCVRSAGEPVPATDEEPNGYCSGECINDQDCGAKGFVCRELFLDQAFLDQLRANLSEEEYARYFGRIQNTKFCARATR